MNLWKESLTSLFPSVDGLDQLELRLFASLSLSSFISIYIFSRRSFVFIWPSELTFLFITLLASVYPCICIAVCSLLLSFQVTVSLFRFRCGSFSKTCLLSYASCTRAVHWSSPFDTNIKKLVATRLTQNRVENKTLSLFWFRCPKGSNDRGNWRICSGVVRRKRKKKAKSRTRRL